MLYSDKRIHLHTTHQLIMGIASKISLPSPSWWKLNAIYLFNLTLILLFLILPAITGPATKLWWMTITYSTPGVKGEAGGSSWKMGGLGVCKSGEECTRAGSSMAPAISGQIKSVLMYHFAGMPFRPLSCLSCQERRELMSSGCDDIPHCGGATHPHPPTKGISMERMDDILLTYLRHPPCYLSDGSRLDRPRSSDER
jgi:hypothetical protein